MKSIALVLIIILVYFVPSFFAIGKRNIASIFILNLFLGWTLVGWVIALIWAFMKDPEKS
jgi:hypothetical protein